ncbi:MAG: hypothetical protein WDN00_15930 [Limisphaerales bacterium]
MDNPITFPPGQSDPEDDADGDGLKNVFEYYFGSNPTSAASGAPPTVISVNSGGQSYPAITFIRSQNVSGITLIPQVSSTVQFGNSLGSTLDSVVDLGNGTERVTIRSNVSMALAGRAIPAHPVINTLEKRLPTRPATASPLRGF